jgi:hypothetical protein
MRKYLRLFVVLLLTAIPWMAWFGDYNMYIGEGEDREVKGLATPMDRLVGGLCLGTLYTAIVMFLFWVSDPSLSRDSDLSRCDDKIESRSQAPQ